MRFARVIASVGAETVSGELWVITTLLHGGLHAQHGLVCLIQPGGEEAFRFNCFAGGAYGFAVRIENAPSLEVLKNIAEIFEGEHDYKAFCASGSAVKTTVRTVYEVRVEESESFGSRDIRIYVTGNGFLYNMVRIISGAMVAVGEGKLDVKEVEKTLLLGERPIKIKTMPAKGLTLYSVIY